MIEQGKIILLDNDKSYIVVSTAELDGNKYLLLINEEDQTDIKICIEEDDEYGKKVVLLNDNEDISQILKALYKNGMEEYNKNVPEEDKISDNQNNE
jgi:hypothetical protein